MYAAPRKIMNFALVIIWRVVEETEDREDGKNTHGECIIGGLGEGQSRGQNMATGKAEGNR